jgi:hypothetical protein
LYRRRFIRLFFNPKNKGKKSYQPILSFIAETHEYIGGELRSGDRPDGKQIARHLRSVIAALPKGIQKIFARAKLGALDVPERIYRATFRTSKVLHGSACACRAICRGAPMNLL